ncbi:MAG: IS200/IS605 family accessory protein TnpB-related protein, partial [Thermoproteus sp.]|nr:IS200/IS605 family accessory protein TnpB-related protein [Thermoproteus sp.]
MGASPRPFPKTKSKKKDRRRKIAKLIAREAGRRGCTIAVEDLPKNVPSHMIERIEDKRLRNRIYQAGFRGVLREIEEGAEKEGVIKVDPSPTWSTGTAPRDATYTS